MLLGASPGPAAAGSLLQAGGVPSGLVAWTRTRAEGPRRGVLCPTAPPDGTETDISRPCSFHIIFFFFFFFFKISFSTARISSWFYRPCDSRTQNPARGRGGFPGEAWGAWPGDPEESSQTRLPGKDDLPSPSPVWMSVASSRGSRPFAWTEMVAPDRSVESGGGLT